MTRKICVIITARGNYAKMKHVIREIRNHPDLELQVILGGSIILEKYGRILETTYVDDFNVDHVIHFLIEGETPLTMAKSAGLAVTEFANAFDNLRPDVVLVIADRYECLAITMAATYMNIPVAHIEGGEVSGSIDESIRHAITKMAHVHFPASEEAAQRIIRMGERSESVYTVGSTSFDVLAEIDLDNLEPLITYQRIAGAGEAIPVQPGQYAIVIQHPVTTEYVENLAHIEETVKAIHKLQIPTFWIWPNMDAGSDGISKGIRLYREKYQPKYAHFFKSLPIELFGPLLKNAGCIVGNSSSGIREAAYLGTPCVNIGSRQHGRARGQNVVDVGYAAAEIEQAVRRQMEHGRYKSDNLYGDGMASKKIVSILAEYDFISQKTIRY